jgi:serine/threonine protein kinase/tetratricopeptide (TPR) repeat protein
MGLVYEATDTSRGSVVALKQLSGSHASALLRFKQEFRSLADLSHANLAALYELFTADGSWFFSMELVDGVDFLSYVRGGSPAGAGAPGVTAETSDRAVTGEISTPAIEIEPAAGHAPSPDQIARLRGVLPPLASGLVALHGANTLHCDIKPSNVMVEPSGRLVLLDFGLATPVRDYDSEGRALSIAGTVSYMAPEQATGEALTPAVDWYAVGVMMYQVLAGQVPFTGSTSDVLRAKLTTAPPPLPKTVPADLAELCLALLRRTPSERPSGPDVLAWLGMSPQEPGASEEVFFGRGTHLASLREALADVQSNRPSMAFVRGRSGAGKSYLVHHFLSSLRSERDIVILPGRCYEEESVPYKALDSLIDALAVRLRRMPKEDVAALAPRDVSALTRLFPVLRDVPAFEFSARREQGILNPQEVRRRAFLALRELFARLSDRYLVVVHIDDLQWGDDDSAALLGDLLRPPDPPVLLLLCSYRSEWADRSSCIRTLRAAVEGSGAVAHEIAVEPFDVEDAMRLAAALLPEHAADGQERAARIARESGGMPFFIHALARYAESDLASAPGSGAGELDDVILRRVERFVPEARRLLQTIAVCGHPVTRRDACRAAGFDGVDPGTLRLLRTEHLIRSTGPEDRDWVEPYHDRIREVIAAHMDPAVRSDFHSRLAFALEASDDRDLEAVAVHFEGAGKADRAADYYQQAGDAAADALAFGRAARLFSRALALGSGTPEQERSLRIKYADALANDGHGHEAGHEYLRATEGAALDLVRDLRLKAAYQYCVSGHLEEGREALRKLLEHVGGRLKDSRVSVIAGLLWTRARLRLRGLQFQPRPESAIEPHALVVSDVTWAASAGISMFDVLAGAELQARNLLQALTIGEPYRVARALAWEAAHSSNGAGKSWPRTERLLAEARRISAAIGHPHAEAMVALSTGIAEFTMGRWQSARDRLGEAEERLRTTCTGVAWELDTCNAFGLWARMYGGDFLDMGRRADVLMREANERGDLYASTTIGGFVLPHVLLAQGRPDEAMRAVDDAMGRWRPTEYRLQHLNSLYARVYIDLYSGDSAASLLRAERARREWVSSGFYGQIQMSRIVGESLLGRAALLMSVDGKEPHRMARIVRKTIRRLDAERTKWGHALANLLRAGQLHQTGRSADAAQLLDRTAATLDEVPMTQYAATARWRAAQLLGSGSKADALRESARAWATREGVADIDRLSDTFVFRLTPVGSV